MSPHHSTSHSNHFYQWQTCFLVKVQHWRKEKNVKAALAFSPLHILLAKLMLCSAIFIQATNSQPGPLPSHVLASKSRLQRENVINSMERKHRLSIIHVPLCCYLRLSFSTHSKRLGQGWPHVLISSMLPLSRSDICLLSQCHMREHTHTYTKQPTCMVQEWRLSQLYPKYSDGLEFSVVGRELCCRGLKHACLHADGSINKPLQKGPQRKTKLVQRAKLCWW